MSPTRTEFKKVGENHYRLTAIAEGLQFDALRLRWERHELMGELIVAADFPGAKRIDGILSRGSFNLSSIPARGTRAKDLAARACAPEIDFGQHLEELCQRTMAAEEQGEPILNLPDVELLDPADAAPVVVGGFPILRRDPLIVFADGGSCKSTIALYLAGLLVRRGMHVLYLDWEMHKEHHRQQLGRLFGSDGSALPDVKYRRCTQPLAMEAESLSAHIQDCWIDYVVCDSIAFACDGPPEAAEVATRYFRALRQLRVGSFNLAHIIKGEQGDRRPFGSTFWYNGCRACWYAEKADAAALDRRTHVGLFNRKLTDGPKPAALGFDLHYDGDYGPITVTPANVADNDQLAAKLPLSQRMHVALRRGPLTLAALAEETGGTIETLERYARKAPNVYTRICGADGVTRIALVERRTA